MDFFMNTIYLASGNAHRACSELQTALEQAGLPISVKGPDEIGGMPEVGGNRTGVRGKFAIEGGRTS